MKVNVNEIPGYSEMSAEDKIKALEAFEFEAPKQTEDGEVKKLREALSKTNSEAANLKRALHEKMSEAEKAEAERKEREQQIEEELNTLRKDRKIATLEKAYLAAGYPADLAAASAVAQAEGDTDTVLKNQMAYLSETRKKLESEALNKQPPLSVGNPPAGKPLTEEDRIAELAMKYAGL